MRGAGVSSTIVSSSRTGGRRPHCRTLRRSTTTFCCRARPSVAGGDLEVFGHHAPATGPSSCCSRPATSPWHARHGRGPPGERRRPWRDAEIPQAGCPALRVALGSSALATRATPWPCGASHAEHAAPPAGVTDLSASRRGRARWARVPQRRWGRRLGRGRCQPPEPERVVGAAEVRGHRRPSGGTPRRSQEAVVPYGVDSSDGMASPAGSEERQRCQAFRRSKPPSGPSATGIPSRR
jgi:hypothetical protein